MMKRRIALIFGGKSAEHQVSLQSAKNIIEAIDKEKYEVVLIGIDRQGKWFLLDDPEHFLLHADDPSLIALNTSKHGIAFVPGENDHPFLTFPNGGKLGKLDAVFPILHGSLGEDGSIQGMLRIAGLPYVGPGVLGSAASMDKEITKKLLSKSGLAVADYLCFSRAMKDAIKFEKAVARLGLPLFIKPANQGSSVGITRVETKDDFYKGIDHAFDYDHKIIIEEAIAGSEIECAVLGNEEPVASLPGKILPQQSFYSYDAKYLDQKGACLNIPANLSEDMVIEVRKLAVKAYQVLQCEGMARVDFFLTKDHNFIVNEINTLPGFTKLSMYPKLWEVSGISYRELINKLIAFAIERHQKDTLLKGWQQ
ncbi:D-alanine-D-alanine ligase [Evansella caseinilytica]|uniref:D-alanine--D-alanine ligase n=1 Tax=Evansella caseinilytica TaxID=1503961 RepID=A0A1H3R3J3_9BACI|nr:D-alanine--D-alanine ligase [Evansella caseinilytica]SDZ19885.1 D-alanine-D-alanine ligase [Evansella caseinilytica]